MISTDTEDVPIGCAAFSPARSSSTDHGPARRQNERCADGEDPLDEPLLQDSTTDHDERDSWMQRFSHVLRPTLGAADTSSSATFCIGGFSLAVVGLLLGSIMPFDEALPSPLYRWFSNCVGYTYFLSWSVSFYPQLLSNYRRKTTVGLSADFAALNVVGFSCYAMYVCALYFSPTIQDQYHSRYGPDTQISVQSNDVAFAVHALVLTICSLGQIAYYDGLRQPQGPSRLIVHVIVALLGVILLTPTFVLLSARQLWWGTFTWLDYFYVLSFIKLGVTLIKYVPQVILNYQRKSTLGWSIWQILLDLTGGVLSDAQLVGDCYMLGDWSGITGNLAKLFLGIVSIAFDTVFMLQHYFWYADTNTELITEGNHVRDVDLLGLLL